MKKIFSLLILSSLIFAGCSNWLDVNTDPGNPSDVGAELILPAAEASLATRLGGTLYNLGGFYAEYWTQAPEANQYNNITTYDLRTDFMDGDYQELFAGALNDLERVRTLSEEKGTWGNYLAATVLRAYTFQVWVDAVDKSPYSQALKGTEFVNPEWEDGSAVYAGVLSEIDNALSKIESGSTVSSTDLILGGDLDEWIGFANALKLKLLMRQSNVNNVSSEVNALIDANNFMTADVAMNVFEDAVGKRNPWYETTQDLNTDQNHVAAIPIIRFLNAKADPRISVLYAPAATSGTYEGFYPALKEIELGHLTTDYSRAVGSATQPVYLYSMAELYLFIAEAELRFNNDKNAAKIAYEKAVDAGLSTKGIDPSTVDLYSSSTKPYYFDVSKTTDELFEQIMMQKWVALCQVNNYEAWCELRRTNIPKYFGNLDDYGDGTTYIAGEYLDPAKNLLPTGYYVPNRMPYPDLAVSRNTNTPKLSSVDGFIQKVWWDNN